MGLGEGAWDGPGLQHRFLRTRSMTASIFTSRALTIIRQVFSALDICAEGILESIEFVDAGLS